MSIENTPLASVDPDSIKFLFDANPNTLSDTEFKGLLVELRRRRSEFASAEAAKAAKGKSARAVKGPVSASTAASLDKPAGEISLEDLLGDAAP